MKKMQSSTIHLGNIGEHKIASLLSPFCIVRNVAQGRDTGIDLYCEILKEDDLEPTLHFFCQVKTRKKHIQDSEIKKDLHYWANQPVPVFEGSSLGSNLNYTLCKQQIKLLNSSLIIEFQKKEMGD